MSRKPRADSSIENLPPEQRAAIDQWLFIENLGYAKAREQMAAQFGCTLSVGALYGYYQRSQQKRLLLRIEAARETADAIRADLEKSAPLTSASAIQLISQKTFELAAAHACDAKELYLLTRLMLDARGQDLKQQALSLEREKFQFDAAKAALKELPRLREIASDSGMNEMDKLNQARLALFGATPA